jgi:hypothetical protein
MRFRLRRVVIAVALIASVQLIQPLPIAAEDLARTLERPISPGSIALLAAHSQQPEARQRLLAALEHENAAIRATAARVAFVTMTTELTPDLTRALAKEQDVHTAAEQARAIAAMAGAPGDAAVLAAVERFRHPVALVMAEQLARNRPRQLARHLPALLAVGNYSNEADTLAQVVAMAGAQHPTVAEEILTGAMGANQRDFWMHVLDAVRETTRPISPNVVQRALSSEDAAVRASTALFLIRAHREEDSLTEDVLKLAAPKPIAEAAGPTWEDFARELFARQRGAAPTNVDWSAFLRAEVTRDAELHLPYHALGLLTDAEVKVLEPLPAYVNLPARRDEVRKGTWIDYFKPQARTTMIRTFPVFAPGLMKDLMAVTGCHANSDVPYVAGSLTYRADGGPERVTLMFDTLSNGCQAFLGALMALNVALPSYAALAATEDHVFVYLDRRAITCVDNPFPGGGPVPAGAKIQLQKVQRQPKVTYPPSMMDRRRTKNDNVMVGLRINHAGCVSSAMTARSVTPAFDLAAITSMFSAQWTPATADGRPIPSYWTVTVSFAP